jgi:2-aminoadipate transaminase
MSLQVDARDWTASFAARTKGDVGEGLAAILDLANATDIISFSGGFPDPATFPGEVLAELFTGLIHSKDSEAALQYAPTRGLPGPRAFMAERLAQLEGLRPRDEELLITSGGIEALELLSKVFLDPGDIAAVEGPTYLGAIMAFRSFQAQIDAIPMDDEGLELDRFADLLAAGRRPKFLYTIPDYQNPTGVSMSPERRRGVVDLARRYGFLVIEDVAYRELGFDDARHSSIWSIGPDVTVQSGTFAKTFFPGVRLGWAAGPPGVIEKMTAAKQNTDQCAGALGQRLLEEYGRRGLLEDQARRARDLYRSRCRLLLDALDRLMPPEASWTRPTGGFFSWMRLPTSIDTVEMAKAAMDRKVAFVPGPPFFADGSGRDALRLAFSRVQDDQIEEGVRRLASVVEAALASPAGK